MKILRYITILVVAMAAVACREASLFFGYDTVVKVGHSALTNADIAAALPKGITGSDSVSYVASYIDKWVIRQLKLQEAELIFSDAELDINRQVEEYRQSLLIRKIEQYYIDKDIDFEITEEDIVSYYNSHKGDFRLTSPMVKGYVVAFPEKFRRKDWLLKMMGSAKSLSGEQFAELEQVCLKNNFKIVKCEEWVDNVEFLAHLPLLRTASNEKLLSSRNLQQIRHDSSVYCFRVTESLSVGEPMPLFMVRDNIVRILAKRRQGEVVRQNEQRMVDNALQNGLISGEYHTEKGESTNEK